MSSTAKSILWFWIGGHLGVVASNACTSLNRRESWNALTNDQKADYIQADICLQNQPEELGIDGAANLWDDLQWIHIIQSNFIHGSGQFLPWHRYYVRVHELLLQTRCNYTGSHPYWDELGDVEAGPVQDSPIFDPTTGLGGNGTGAGLCVTDGPFQGLSLHINETGFAVPAYCLSRNLSQAGFDLANSTYLDPCMAKDNYTAAWPCFNTGGPHGAGHQGTGGVMLQLTAAPGDPVFFLHHAYLDRVWWQWQQKDLPTRLYDMGGSNIPDSQTLNLAGEGYPSAALTDYDGDPGNSTTLAHVLWMGGLFPNVTVGDVMDIGDEVICAQYAN